MIRRGKHFRVLLGPPRVPAGFDIPDFHEREKRLNHDALRRGLFLARQRELVVIESSRPSPAPRAVPLPAALADGRFIDVVFAISGRRWRH